jgi:hypothetical protein
MKGIKDPVASYFFYREAKPIPPLKPSVPRERFIHEIMNNDYACCRRCAVPRAKTEERGWEWIHYVKLSCLPFLWHGEQGKLSSDERQRHRPQEGTLRCDLSSTPTEQKNNHHLR